MINIVIGYDTLLHSVVWNLECVSLSVVEMIINAGANVNSFSLLDGEPPINCICRLFDKLDDRQKLMRMLTNHILSEDQLIDHVCNVIKLFAINNADLNIPVINIPVNGIQRRTILGTLDCEVLNEDKKTIIRTLLDCGATCNMETVNDNLREFIESYKLRNVKAAVK